MALRSVSAPFGGVARSSASPSSLSTRRMSFAHTEKGKSSVPLPPELRSSSHERCGCGALRAGARPGAAGCRSTSAT